MNEWQLSKKPDTATGKKTDKEMEDERVCCGNGEDELRQEVMICILLRLPRSLQSGNAVGESVKVVKPECEPMRLPLTEAANAQEGVPRRAKEDTKYTTDHIKGEMSFAPAFRL